MTSPGSDRDRPGTWASDRLDPPRPADLATAARTGRILSIIFGSAMTVLLLLTALVFLAQGRTGLAIFELAAATATGTMVGLRITTLPPSRD